MQQGFTFFHPKNSFIHQENNNSVVETPYFCVGNLGQNLPKTFLCDNKKSTTKKDS